MSASKVSYSRNDLTTTLLPNNEPEQQYYKFNSPITQRRTTLHVIDADHGVFESRNDNLKKNKGKFHIKKMFKKSNDSKPDVFIDQSTDLGLRAEPDLLEYSEINNFSQNSKRNSNKSKRYPSNVAYTDALSYNNNMKSRQSISNIRNSYQMSRNYPNNRSELLSSVTSSISERGILPSLSSPNKFNSTARTNSSQIVMPFKQDKSMLKSNKNQNADMDQVEQYYEVPKGKIPQIQLAYEKMKHKAEKYKNQRDLLKMKNDMNKLRQQLVDYQFYCVNGIKIDANNNLDRRLKDNSWNNKMGIYANSSSDSDSDSDNSVKYIKSRQINSQDSYLKNDRKKKNTQFNEINTPFKFNIPSPKDLMAFHNSTIQTLQNFPFGNLLVPYLQLLKLFFKDGSPFASITICVIDMFILTIYAFIMYKFFKVIVPIFLFFLKIVKTFGLI